MNHACNIQGGFHSPVIACAATDFLIIAHNADLTLPESDIILFQGVAQSLAAFPHILHRGVCPIAVAGHKPRMVFKIADIGVGAVRGKERLYLIATVGACLMGRHHAAVVGRFRRYYPGGKAARLQFFVKHTGKPCNLAFCCRGAFLLGTLPVPVPVGLVHR